MRISEHSGPIICSVDGGAASYAAAAVSAPVADALDRELILAHVYEPPPLGMLSEQGDETMRRAALEMLRRLESQLPSALRSRTEVLHGPLIGTLLAFSDSNEAAMIVAGTRAFGRLSSALRGSVAHRLVTGARRPVLVVPEGSQPPGHGEEPTFLCGYDASPTANTALDACMTLAAACGARVLVIYVEPTTPPLFTAGAALSGGHRLSLEPDGDGRAAERRLDQAAERAGRYAERGVRVQLELASGQPSERLAEKAAASRADLITVGSRGLGPFETAFLGSTAASLVRSAGCPILICPPGSAATEGAHPGLDGGVLSARG